MIDERNFDFTGYRLFINHNKQFFQMPASYSSEMIVKEFK